MPDVLSDTAKMELRRLGFSDYEVRTYIALLQQNPATAYQVSKSANIPRANAYGVLETLSQKKAVVAISQNPAKFVPTSPEILFPQIAKDTQDRCSYIERELKNIDTSDHTEVVWNLEGQDKIDDKILEIISGASKQIWIKADRRVIERYSDELAAAAKRGVSLLIILFGIDHDPFQFGKNARVLIHEGNGVRMGDADNLFTMATDFETALTANVTGPPVATYTQSRPIVTISESLIRHDMYMAEIFDKFGDQIDEAFGPHLYELRSRYFSEEQMIKLTETMSHVSGWSQSDAPKTMPRKKVRGVAGE